MKTIGIVICVALFIFILTVEFIKSNGVTNKELNYFFDGVITAIAICIAMLLLYVFL